MKTELVKAIHESFLDLDRWVWCSSGTRLYSIYKDNVTGTTAVLNSSELSLHGVRVDESLYKAFKDMVYKKDEARVQRELKEKELRDNVIYESLEAKFLGEKE